MHLWSCFSVPHLSSLSPGWAGAVWVQCVHTVPVWQSIYVTHHLQKKYCYLICHKSEEIFWPSWHEISQNCEHLVDIVQYPATLSFCAYQNHPFKILQGEWHRGSECTGFLLQSKSQQHELICKTMGTTWMRPTCTASYIISGKIVTDVQVSFLTHPPALLCTKWPWCLAFSCIICHLKLATFSKGVDLARCRILSLLYYHLLSIITFFVTWLLSILVCGSYVRIYLLTHCIYCFWAGIFP